MFANSPFLGQAVTWHASMGTSNNESFLTGSSFFKNFTTLLTKIQAVVLLDTHYGIYCKHAAGCFRDNFFVKGQTAKVLILNTPGYLFTILPPNPTAVNTFLILFPLSIHPIHTESKNIICWLDFSLQTDMNDLFCGSGILLYFSITKHGTDVLQKEFRAIANFQVFCIVQ